MNVYLIVDCVACGYQRGHGFFSKEEFEMQLRKEGWEDFGEDQVCPKCAKTRPWETEKRLYAN